MTKARKLRCSPAKLCSVDDFLKQEGKLNEFQAVALKEVLAWSAKRKGKYGKRI